MAVNRTTPWRHLGAVPLAVWQKRITDAGGLTEAAQQDVWEALGDDSALALGMLDAESSYASHFDAIPASKKNIWNLQIAGVGLAFPTIREGALAWRNRLYDSKYKQNIYGKTVTIADLVETYAPASDGNDTERYIATVVSNINRNGIDPAVTTPGTAEEPTMAITFGRVPKPPAINKHIPSSQNTAWDNLGPRAKVPNAFVLHRMEGGLNGTDDYFRRMANARYTGAGGLTNIGIGVAAMDGNALAGVTYEWNAPENDTESRAGWANGQVKAPYGDGLKYVNMFGINAVNRDTESCEISGSYTTPLDAKSIEAIAARLAWRADQYGAQLAAKGQKFDHTTFPYIPSQDRNYTILHQEFTIGSGKVCPGSVVMAATDTIIARAKAIMERYQAGSVAPPVPEPEPVYVAAAPVPKGSKIINEYVFLAPGGKTVQRDEYPRKWADVDAGLPTGPKLTKGTKITQEQISHYVVGSDGSLWVVLTDVPGVKSGSRFPASALIGESK